MIVLDFVHVNWNGVVQFLIAATPFLVAVNMLIGRFNNRRVKRLQEQIKRFEDKGLKQEVKQALDEHREEHIKGG